jgi:hypothetical protein
MERVGLNHISFIWLEEAESLIVTDPELFAGKSGVFHAVWSNFRSDGSGGSGYYAFMGFRQTNHGAIQCN